MNLPEPLRYNPFRLRKRRSLHSVLFGDRQPGPIRPIDSAVGYGRPSIPVGPSPKPYMSDFHDEYVPHAGLMQTPSNDYQPYDTSANPHIPRPNQPTVADDFRKAALELAGAISFEPGIKYEDSLMDEDFFEIQMKLLNKQFDGPPIIPQDNNELASRILQEHDRDENSEFDQDLRSNMVEIQMAVEQVRAAPLVEVNPESHDIVQTIPQDFFEAQESMFDAQYRESEPESYDYSAHMEDIFNAQEALFDALESGPSPMEQAILDQPMENQNPAAEPISQSLEEIVEAEPMQDGLSMLDDMAGRPGYDDSLMTPELLEQQMDEVAEQMESMEPYPVPGQLGYGMMPQEMYDEQMLYMMDPFMVPGLMDPYMMPGPFGPMLGPGPGGPP